MPTLLQNQTLAQWDTGGTRYLITAIEAALSGRIERLPPDRAVENLDKSGKPGDPDRSHFFVYRLGWKRSPVQVRPARPQNPRQMKDFGGPCSSGPLTVAKLQPISETETQ